MEDSAANAHGFYSHPDFSIIIPYREMDDTVRRCFYKCSQLNGTFEIIGVSDDAVPGFPSAKRNYAMSIAKGKYFVFLDSDAYPDKDWLTKAKKFLRSFDAVCGPGLLPPESPIHHIAADMVYNALPYSYRVIKKPARVVPEFPTFNLIVKREVAGQFPDYLTGEDSLFCRALKCDILYHPDLYVYHDRRPAFIPLFKQVGTYGKHRGHLIRLYLLALIGSVFTYGVNFIKGFFKGVKHGR